MKDKCGHGGKHSKAIKGKYAQGGTVTPAPTLTAAPAKNTFSQGTQKHLRLIQQRRNDARAQRAASSPAAIMQKYFPPAPPPMPSAAPTPSAAAAAAAPAVRQDRDPSPGIPSGNKGSSARYTGLRDMVDGGGPGKSGSTFSGGPFSGAMNKIGVKPVGSGGNMTTSPRPQPKSSPALSKSPSPALSKSSPSLSKSPSSSSKSTSTTSKSSSSSASSGGSKSGGSSGGSKSGGSSGGSKSGGSSGGRR